MRNAMIIDSKDNVAVPSSRSPRRNGHLCLRRKRGVSSRSGGYHHLPQAGYRDIRKGEPVVKYGEHIGIASCDIKAGEHVHVHNVEGHRENLEAKE